MPDLKRPEFAIFIQIIFAEIQTMPIQFLFKFLQKLLFQKKLPFRAAGLLESNLQRWKVRNLFLTRNSPNKPVIIPLQSSSEPA